PSKKQAPASPVQLSTQGPSHKFSSTLQAPKSQPASRQQLAASSPSSTVPSPQRGSTAAGQPVGNANVNATKSRQRSRSTTALCPSPSGHATARGSPRNASRCMT